MWRVWPGRRFFPWWWRGRDSDRGWRGWRRSDPRPVQWSGRGFSSGRRGHPRHGQQWWRWRRLLRRRLGWAGERQQWHGGRWRRRERTPRHRRDRDADGRDPVRSLAVPVTPSARERAPEAERRRQERTDGSSFPGSTRRRWRKSGAVFGNGHVAGGLRWVGLERFRRTGRELRLGLRRRSHGLDDRGHGVARVFGRRELHRPPDGDGRWRTTSTQSTATVTVAPPECQPGKSDLHLHGQRSELRGRRSLHLRAGQGLGRGRWRERARAAAAVASHRRWRRHLGSR